MAPTAEPAVGVQSALKAPRQRYSKKLLAVLVVALILLVIGLSVGLSVGLGVRNHDNSNNTLQSTEPPASWRRDPQDYVLSPSFDKNAPNITRTFTLNLTEMADGAPDGVSVRVLLINGQFPGPVIEANEGDRLVIQVNNFMTLPSAIHWHGQYQNGTSRRSVGSETT